MATITDEGQRGALRFGFWASLSTGLVTLFTFAAAIATPPLSGAWCRAGCYSYPFLDVGSRFPRDYYWMFAALVVCVLFLAFVLSLRARSVAGRELMAELAVALALMSSLVIGGDYFVQLAAVQPSLLAGEADGVSMLTQYNPHGVFIALEELGYLLMSGALASAAVALPRSSRLERAVRWLLFAGFAVAVATLAGFMATLGHSRGYLFEIAIISIAWLTLIPGALMMAAVFWRQRRPGRDALSRTPTQPWRVAGGHPSA